MGGVQGMVAEREENGGWHDSNSIKNIFNVKNIKFNIKCVNVSTCVWMFVCAHAHICMQNMHIHEIVVLVELRSNFPSIMKNPKMDQIARFGCKHLYHLSCLLGPLT